MVVKKGGGGGATQRKSSSSKSSGGGGGGDTGVVQRDSRLEFRSGQHLIGDVDVRMSSDAREDKNDKTVRRAYRKEKQASQLREIIKKPADSKKPDASHADEIEEGLDSYGAPYETMVELPAVFASVRDTMLYKTLCYYIYWGTLQMDHIFPLTNLAALVADHPQLFNPVDLEELMTSAMVAACDVDQQIAAFLVMHLPVMLDTEANVPCPVDGHTKQSLVKLAVFTLFGLALVRGDIYSHQRWGPTVLQVVSATELQRSGVPNDVITMLKSAHAAFSADMHVQLRNDPR